MHEIVEKILSTEGEAVERISRAREEASSIKAECDRDQERRLREARTQAQERIQAVVAAAREQAAREKDALVAAAREESERFAQTHEEAITRTVRKVVDRLVRPEQAED